MKELYKVLWLTSFEKQSSMHKYDHYTELLSSWFQSVQNSLAGKCFPIFPVHVETMLILFIYTIKRFKITNRELITVLYIVCVTIRDGGGVLTV